MRELISVIIPAYNSERTILKTITSIVNQSYKDIEIIVIDDGSTDGTADVVIDLSSCDSRIKLKTQPNKGPSAARNLGMELASGEYLMFVDSDDELVPNAVEQLHAYMDDNVDLVVCGFSICRPEKAAFELIPSSGQWELSQYFSGIEMLQEKKCFNSLCNKIFRKSIIREHNIQQRCGLSMGEDYLFVVDYFMKMEKCLVCISEPLYKYNLSTNGLQSAYSEGDYLGRIERAEYLKKLYLHNRYPLNGVFNGIVRSIYTVLISSSAPEATVKEIYTLRQYHEIVGNIGAISGLKYKGFAFLLKYKTTRLILFTLGLYHKLKEKKGKALFERNS